MQAHPSFSAPRWATSARQTRQTVITPSGAEDRHVGVEIREPVGSAEHNRSPQQGRQHNCDAELKKPAQLGGVGAWELRRGISSNFAFYSFLLGGAVFKVGGPAKRVKV